MKLVPLSSVCSQTRRQIPAGERADLRYIGLESIEAGTGQLASGELSKTPEAPRASSFHFTDQHVLYSKLRPYLNKVWVPDFEGKSSTELVPLLPSDTLDRRYLAYFLRSPGTVQAISARTVGARMPRADMDFLLGLQIPLPSIEEQRRIVDLLARAEGIVRLRREAQAKVGEIIPALFVYQFGDPASNTQQWPVAPLGEVAEVISGVAKGRKIAIDEAVELPYMRVANVKDGYLDLSSVKRMVIRKKEMDKLLIESGDLLMTEGGDPDKLGRGALWRGEITPCIHQNHVFKVRCDRRRVLPEYLHSLTSSSYGKAYFLRVAKKTTGIASINKTQLSAFPVVIPPMDLQVRFLANAESVRGIASQQEAAVTTAQQAFDALLDRSFSLSDANPQ